MIDWDEPGAKDALVSFLVTDALVEVFASVDPDELTEQAQAALVAGQDVEPAEGSDGTDGRGESPARSPPSESSPR